MLRLSSSLQGKKISWWVIEYLHSWCACSKDNVREVNLEKFSPFSIEHCDISLTDLISMNYFATDTATAWFSLIWFFLCLWMKYIS